MEPENEVTLVSDDESRIGEADSPVTGKGDIAIYVRHPETNAAFCLRGAKARHVWETEMQPAGFEIFRDSESLYNAVDGGPDSTEDDALVDVGMDILNDDGDDPEVEYSADF